MARETADNHVNRPQIWQRGTHIGKLLRVGEAVRQHGAVNLVDFHLPCRLKACLFKSQIKAADAREEAADGRFSLFHSRLTFTCRRNPFWQHVSGRVRRQQLTAF
ncbi:Uncharacterised protein [Neisseria meningitidis]|uniref:Uncharacterized protein n=1 Tax=Neisseria meningitidis TaxID=487 RepID=A0AB33TXN7_NEIME|nr:Uncharacterised protein [Neisseria meningitidis]CWQ05056.1 Uncharacterised protein [Neisseria meningitidis]